jgi:Tfp pilus assembly protein PilN
MIRVNFLTHEYKSKLFFKKFARLSILLILFYIVVIFSINTGINGMIDTKRENIAQANNVINKTKEEIKATKEEMNNIVDLSNKITILEDIMNQKEYGFSESLFQLQEKVPDKVWLTSLVYNGEELIVKGIAGSNRKEKLTSEKNLLLFEKRLKEAERYSNIVPEYARASEIRGSRVQEFQYTITINHNAVELQ